MLLEKAYAKLHGCYEALIHGLTEKCLLDLTHSGHVQVVRRELINPDGRYGIEYGGESKENEVRSCRDLSLSPHLSFHSSNFVKKCVCRNI